MGTTDTRIDTHTDTDTHTGDLDVWSAWAGSSWSAS